VITICAGSLPADVSRHFMWQIVNLSVVVWTIHSIEPVQARCFRLMFHLSSVQLIELSTFFFIFKKLVSRYKFEFLSSLSLAVIFSFRLSAVWLKSFFYLYCFFLER
jgi:hypothetical protein